jgi:prepilin-type N-terminal cleavage/methylation domain-containing protein
MSDDAGFTLVELMFVLLVLAILVAIAIASSTMSSSYAERVACLQNQRTLEGCSLQYSDDHGGDLPLLMDDLSPYVKDPERAMRCPSDPTVGLQFGATPMSVVCPLHPKG